MRGVQTDAVLDSKNIQVHSNQGRIQGGGARGTVPPRPVKGGVELPRRTQSFHTFQILNSRVKNVKKLVCCSFNLH